MLYLKYGLPNEIHEKFNWHKGGGWKYHISLMRLGNKFNGSIQLRKSKEIELRQLERQSQAVIFS